jgi:hypothetical protein
MIVKKEKEIVDRFTTRKRKEALCFFACLSMQVYLSLTAPSRG